jgi:hypothetical protein
MSFLLVRHFSRERGDPVRRSSPGSERPIGALALAIVMVLLAGPTACADGEATRVSARGIHPSGLDDGRVGYVCGPDLCAVDVDGSNPLMVMAAGGSDDIIDYGRTVSPNGRKVAFVRATYDSALGHHAHPRVYVANRDGSNAHRLTTSPGDSTDEGAPRWSTDGKRIAFSSIRFGIVVADADGGRVHSVSRGTGTIPRVRTTLPDWIDGLRYSGVWAWSPR